MANTDKTSTEFGTVTIGADGVRIEATGAELYAWANCPHAWWPCSALGRLEWLRVDFNANGLVDINSNLETEEWEDVELISDEFNAWSSDVLRAANLPSSHPVYPVSVGQFLPKCPECGEVVWDVANGSKLAKCWNAEGHASGGTLAFD